MRLQLMSNICEGTSYKSVKKRAEDRCLWRVFEMEVNDLLFLSVHQKKKKKIPFSIFFSYCDSVANLVCLAAAFEDDEQL